MSFCKCFLRVFFAAKHKFPYPQSLVRRQRLLDNEKIFLRRTALTKDRNGDQGSFLTTPAFIEHYFWCCFYFPDL